MSKPSEPSGAGRPPRDELERALLGDGPVFNAAEVAEATGVSIEQARKLWRALGFPEHGADTAFTESDTEAVALVTQFVRSGLIDFDFAVNATRAVGQTMARLADWETGAVLNRFEESGVPEALQPWVQPSAEKGSAATSGAGFRVNAALALVENFREPFEKLLVYVWRRHFAAAVARYEAMSSADDETPTAQVTVGFADIVSFTALSNQLSQDRLGDLVEVFESRCADVIATQRGRLIKSIGDSVLFVNDDPIRAYDTAEGIINVVGRDPRMPDVRVGLASGSVVMRLGDVFGPSVNMAARLTAVARRNRIIVDAATAALLPDDQFEARRLPARPVHGFGLVEPVTVRRH